MNSSHHVIKPIHQIANQSGNVMATQIMMMAEIVIMWLDGYSELRFSIYSSQSSLSGFVIGR